MSRLFIIGACALSLVLSAGAIASAATTFDVVDLGPCSAAGNGSVAINSHGQVAFFSTDSSGAAVAMLYSPGGGAANLGGQSIGLYGESVGLNDNGDVVSFAWSSASNDYYAVLHHNGAWSDVSGPAGMAFTAGINDSGTIAGEATSDGAVTTGVVTANFGSGTQTTFPLDQNPPNSVYAINNGGIVVGGNYNLGKFAPYAFYYDGNVHPLVNPLNTAYGSGLFAINDSGEMVGYLCDLGNPLPYLYSGGSNGTWTSLAAPSTLGMHANRGDGAYGIASNGDIVGDISFKSSTSAFIYDQSIFLNSSSLTGGQTTDLTTMLDPASAAAWTWTGSGAISPAQADGIAVVNGEDWIVGYTTFNADGQDHAFLLRQEFPGDANFDGRVDINDLTIVLANYGRTGKTWSQGRMDGDPTGAVDINDLTIVLANYGNTVGASASGPAPVPEPDALALLAAGAAGLLAYAWRKRN
jgi:hypothetical protein